MASQAARGKKALDASDYEGAIKEYTAAIKESPTSPDFYIHRSTAYQRTNRFPEALADAEQAVLNAQKRAKRESIVEAQFRRALALYKLARVADAHFLLTIVKDMDPKHKQSDLWLNKSKLDLSKMEEDDEKRKVTVTETPTSPTHSDGSNASSSLSSVSSTAPSSVASPAAPQQTPADKIRHEWYQNSGNIYFTLLAKGVPKDKAKVEITERSLNISFPLLDGSSSYDLTLEPLFAAVVPDKCITRVLSTKVEIILIKKTPGQKWSALESSEPITTEADNNNTSDDPVKKAVYAAAAKPTAPAYPTSSKNGPKDWDKISKELRINDRTNDTDGKPSTSSLNDDDDEFEGGDEANFFFKKLYKNADPDTQRAMMKSYIESNGTALSTNWQEVGAGPVKTEPPDGMEAKEYAK